VLVLFPLVMMINPRLAMLGLVAAIVWKVVDRTRSSGYR